MSHENKQKSIDHPFLFSPMKIGMVQLKNRLVSLPVHTGNAHPDGRVSSWLVDFYTMLARSGAGMVVVANAAVSSDGVVSRYNLRVDKDAFIQGLSELASAIKENGAIACLQLNHAGRFGKTTRPLLPSPLSYENFSFNIESLKGFMESFPFEKRFNLTREFLRQAKNWRHAMDYEDCNRVIDDFSSAAQRAFQAGFDMVELHGANGYLLCQYLSAFTNKLTSGLGGDLNARSTFPLAVIQAVKQHLPYDFPVGFRLILKEWVPGGVDLYEALAFAKLLNQKGIAYLSASAGTFNSIFSRHALEGMGKIAYLRDDVKALSDSVNIPVIISGRITTPSVAEKLIRDGTADLIGLGRPLLCDPGWVKKAEDSTRKITQCINCNRCLKRVILEKGICCARWPKLIYDKTDLAHKLLTRTDKTLWLIANSEDMQTFKQCLPLLSSHLDRQTRCSYRPAMLFLRPENNDTFFDDAKKNFIRWAQDTFGSSIDTYDTSVQYDTSPDDGLKESTSGRKDIIDSIISRGSYGRIFLGSNVIDPWHKKMLYREGRTVVALLNSNENRKKILAPVDLSDASLLVMSFLKRGYITAEGFTVRFIHVLNGSPHFARSRWRHLKAVAGLDWNTPLQLLGPESNVVSALTETVNSGQYGTVVMGKRGLSGIKRLLLGSVSSGVLSLLTDQSLFLVD